MQKLLQATEAVPLSVPQVQSMVPKHLKPFTKVVLFSELPAKGQPEALFPGETRFLVLLMEVQSQGNVGHYMLFTKRNNKKYELFDSLAHSWSQLFAKIVDPKKLLPWIRHRYSPFTNSVPVQADKRTLETCARHCLARLIFGKIPLPMYISSLRKFRDPPDTTVTLLTYSSLQRQSQAQGEILKGGGQETMVWQKYGSDPKTWSPNP